MSPDKTMYGSRLEVRRAGSSRRSNWCSWSGTTRTMMWADDPQAASLRGFPAGTSVVPISWPLS